MAWLLRSFRWLGWRNSSDGSLASDGSVSVIPIVRGNRSSGVRPIVLDNIVLDHLFVDK